MGDHAQQATSEMTLEEKAARLHSELNMHAGGTNTYWRHPLVRSFLYTDGVKHFASNAGNGAFWLLDILATEPAIKAAVLNNYIAYAKLKVQRKKVDSNACSAELVVYQDIDDDGEPVDVAYRREITYTDCPPGDWVFKLGLNEDENGRKIIIICLPIED